MTELLGELKDWIWLVSFAVVPLTAYLVRLQSKVNSQQRDIASLERTLDPDKVQEFNREWAVLRVRVDDHTQAISAMREKVENLDRRVDAARQQ